MTSESHPPAEEPRSADAPRGPEEPPPEADGSPSADAPQEPRPPHARRLHPAAVGAEALDALRGLALPVLVVALVGGGGVGRLLVYGVLGLVLSVGMAWVQWTTTRWYLSGDEVRLRRGVLSESITAVPLERVQAVDTVRGPVQRLFGVVELHVQAAGGSRRGEIVLKAVDDAAADELREAVRHAGAASPPSDAAAPAVASQPTWRLGRRELLIAAVTSGSLGVLVPVVAAASQVLDDVLRPDDAERLLPDTIAEGALLGLAVLAAAWLLSVVGTVVAFSGFTVVRDGERLRIKRGIVERREASVPVARVHAVRLVESPLREPFGLAQVRVETAGYASEPASAQTLLPLVRRREAEAVLGELVPELGLVLGGLTPLPGRAVRRYALAPTAVAALAAAALVVAFGTAALPALLLLPAAVALGFARHRAGGWHLAGGRLVLRTRRLARTTAAADARRLQAVHTAVTPFQARAALATLAVDVSSGRRLALRHLDDATAADLRAELAAAASSPPPNVRESPL
jgi:putative membrane protein